MKKNTVKFLSNIFTVCMFFITIGTFAFAGEELPEEVEVILTEILEVLLTIAGIVCVGKVIQIGIMYMTSSAVDKSNAKAAIFPWLLGTVVCFGAAWIGPFIIGLFKIDGKVLDI